MFNSGNLAAPKKGWKSQGKVKLMGRRLYENLKAYSESDFYPFHMPGHKRNPDSGQISELYRIDITEIDGFDDLHRAETIIYDSQMRAAKLYQSENTYFLVNGSTSGILSAVSAISSNVGEKLIIARNCHKAVYHAAFLNRMRLCYVYPEMNSEYDIADAITASQLERAIVAALEEKDQSILPQKEGKIAGVVITSPTYDGICSNVEEIAETAHKYGLPLIVDQAHGAHLGLHPEFPENAVCQGADLVIHSVHKTLPAPTQTALLHRNGNLVDEEKLRKYLRIYQSSSPSYLLMAGIDEAVSIAQADGERRLSRLLEYRKYLLKEIKDCKYIRVCPDTEPGKLVISVKGSSLTGQHLYDILREKYHLQMEMASGTYVLAILTMMDTWEGIRRLSKALIEVDCELCGSCKEDLPIPCFYVLPEKDLELWEAFLSSAESIELQEAQGRTVVEFINLYPPGIPILVPGEKISKELISMICRYQEYGYTIQGIDGQKVKVKKEESRNA